MAIKIDPAVINLVIQDFPVVIQFFQDAYRKINPEAPVPTSEDVLAAFDTQFGTSLATDQSILEWLATYPAEDLPPTTAP